MANTGYKNPSANSGDFVNPTNAYADGGGNATSVHGEVHQYYDYDLLSVIPAGAVINGIVVRVDAWAALSFGCFYRLVLSWDGGTSWTSGVDGDKRVPPSTDLPISETIYTSGGPTDLWGRSWIRSELSDANFRVKITSANDPSTVEAYLDWIPVDIYYTVPAVPPTRRLKGRGGDARSRTVFRRSLKIKAVMQLSWSKRFPKLNPKRF